MHTACPWQSNWVFQVCVYVCVMQEAELSLQRLASGLRELDTMKTDLPQYVAAGDSALLEQQLEQLHGQWEELCMKVSTDKKFQKSP